MRSATPNVVLIIMDDLACGDLACLGNPHTHTPHLDRLHANATRFTQTCSGPLCTPARAMLMTGRYAYRTRAIDTYCGRTTLDPAEVTLAQVLKNRGYATCLSGKWHLGDNAPSRPQDMGFDEVLMHRGGGLRQPCNDGFWDGDDAYENPWLMHNGRGVRTHGYCTDVFTDHAINFIENHAQQPFFLYLATNAPHSPFEVGERWLERYQNADLPDKFKRVYAMVDNIDHNIGRVMRTLEQQGIARNTIVIFTSDHGPCGSASHEGRVRFNAGLRSFKGRMYDGGIRVPAFWHWPGQFAAGRDVDRVSCHIDVLPTLAALCDANVPRDRKIDGVDLSPLLLDKTTLENWPARTLFLQWHRGDVPQRFNNCMARTQRYKLVNGVELYDMQNDPGETTDLAASLPEVVAQLRAEYEAWFDDVSHERPDNYAPPAIHLGSPRENPVVLNRNDRRPHGPDSWAEDETLGHWEVEAVGGADARYDVTAEFRAINSAAGALVTLDVSGSQWTLTARPGQRRCVFENLTLGTGRLRLEATAVDGGQRLGARYVIVRRTDIASQ